MFEREPGYSAQRDLWQAVLMQAIHDALHGVSTGDGTASKAARIRMTEETRDYLTIPSQDLSTVCNLAGLDPVAVMERMRKQIAAAPTPEELIGEPEPQKPRTSRMGCNANPLTYAGKTLTIRQWSERTGIKIGTIGFRLREGWTVEDALSIPTGGRRCAPAVLVR